jgi:hypothetical protein
VVGAGGNKEREMLTTEDTESTELAEKSGEGNPNTQVKNRTWGTHRVGGYCGLVVKDLRPEGLSYRETEE